MKYGVPESTVSVFSLLRLKGVFLITVCCIGIASTWISLDPTLEPHMEQVVREMLTGCKLDFSTMFLWWGWCCINVLFSVWIKRNSSWICLPHSSNDLCHHCSSSWQICGQIGGFLFFSATIFVYELQILFLKLFLKKNTLYIITTNSGKYSTCYDFWISICWSLFSFLWTFAIVWTAGLSVSA